MQLNLKRPIVFFDLETTGLSITNDRIVEISLLKIYPNGNKESKTWLVNPTIPIPKEVIDIHNITNEKVENEPTFEELAPKILEIIKDSDLAGFNSNTTVSYKFRGTTGNFTGYNASSTGAAACAYGLDGGNSYNRQFSTSSRSDSVDEAGGEMVDAGVLFVTSAGNNNQYLTNTKDDPHRLDYFTTLNGGDNRTGHWPSGTCPSAGKEWIHPQHIGYNSTTDYYPTITVGCLDEYIGGYNFGPAYCERKVSYSNNGPGIDVWSPGDETLSSGTNYNVGYTDYQRYDNNSFFDCYFNGTSAAAPIVTGVIALYLEVNQSATSQDVRTWIKNYGSIGMGETGLLNDEYPDNTTEDYWRQDYNLRGADPKIIHDPYASDTIPSIKGVNVTGVSFTQT